MTEKSQTEKRIKSAVSFIVYNHDRSKVLGVLRPPDDKELPDVWGLPATSAKDNESLEQAVKRAGQEKLGVKLKIKSLIGEDSAERADYILRMRDYETEIVEGEPAVPQSGQPGTQYVDWKWIDPSELREAAEKGSLCTRIFLSHIG